MEKFFTKDQNSLECDIHSVEKGRLLEDVYKQKKHRYDIIKKNTKNMRFL